MKKLEPKGVALAKDKSQPFLRARITCSKNINARLDRVWSSEYLVSEKSITVNDVVLIADVTSNGKNETYAVGLQLSVQ